MWLQNMIWFIVLDVSWILKMYEQHIFCDLYRDWCKYVEKKVFLSGVDPGSYSPISLQHAFIPVFTTTYSATSYRTITKHTHITHTHFPKRHTSTLTVGQELRGRARRLKLRPLRTGGGGEVGRCEGGGARSSFFKTHWWKAAGSLRSSLQPVSGLTRHV